MQYNLFVIVKIVGWGEKSIFQLFYAGLALEIYKNKKG
ncbi:hypothetical protein ADICYQ_2574 [Cyclobacterium qasimii M12-11B]|uniref:Uncharacterized protein n=1 Tax=Cyclobacterium qasimii M12-11B TaxID=641524 RepID=S7WWI7_9BACT|nr:hypothetical protein ADICYQ_2574 [Cyclobacterium qasimii M12-11B]